LTVVAAGTFVPMVAREDRVSWMEWQPGEADWQDREGRVTDLGGARHQSAVSFIRSNRGALAAVCSQDGGITLMSWPSEEKVALVARHVEQAVAS
jgi:hypothetical protein